MPIDFACRCGRQFRAKDHWVGRSVSCPACGGDLVVPADSPDSGNTVDTSADAPSSRIVAPVAKGYTDWYGGILMLIAFASPVGLVSSRPGEAAIVFTLSIVGLGIMHAVRADCS